MMDEETRKKLEALYNRGLLSSQPAPVVPAEPQATLPEPLPAAELPQGTLMNIGGMSIPVPAVEDAGSITKTTVPMTPELKAAQDLQMGVAQQAQENVKNLQSELAASAEQRQSAMAEKARLTEQAALQEADQRKQINQEYQSGLAQVAARQQELDALEPKDFWADKSTGQKVGIALAVLLGGIGQGLSGAKENAAINALNQAISDDLRLQETQYKRKVTALGLQKQAVMDKRVGQLDVLQEMEARKQASFAKVNGQIEQAMLGADSAERKAKLEQASLMIQQQAAESATKFARDIAGTVVEKGALLNADGSVKPGVKPAKLAVGEAALDRELGTRSGKLTTFLSDMQSLKAQMDDPNLSEDQKIAAMLMATKDMQSKYGADAVTGSDEERVQGFLKPRGYQILPAAAAGAQAGAAVGGLAGSIGAAGIGALPGAAIGAGIGAVSQGVSSAFEQMSKPGGLTFKVNLPAAVEQLNHLIDRSSLSLERSSLVSQGLKGGLNIETANKLADQMMGQRASKLQSLQTEQKVMDTRQPIEKLRDRLKERK